MSEHFDFIIISTGAGGGTLLRRREEADASDALPQASCRLASAISPVLAK